MQNIKPEDKRLIQFAISNTSDCDYPLQLFQDTPDSQPSINSTIKYAYDITGINLACGLAFIEINSIVRRVLFPQGTLSSLLNGLNALGFGFFCTETIAGHTYLYTADDTNVYGLLTICQIGTTTTTTSTSTSTSTTSTSTTTTHTPTSSTTTTTTTTTAAPTTTTTTTTTTLPGQTTTTTTTTTTAPPPTTTTTTTTTTAPPTSTTTTTTTTTVADPATTTLTFTNYSSVFDPEFGGNVGKFDFTLSNAVPSTTFTIAANGNPTVNGWSTAGCTGGSIASDSMDQVAAVISAGSTSGSGYGTPGNQLVAPVIRYKIQTPNITINGVSRANGSTFTLPSGCVVTVVCQNVACKVL